MAEVDLTVAQRPRPALAADMEQMEGLLAADDTEVGHILPCCVVHGLLQQYTARCVGASWSGRSVTTETIIRCNGQDTIPGGWIRLGGSAGKRVCLPAMFLACSHREARRPEPKRSRGVALLGAPNLQRLHGLLEG